MFKFKGISSKDMQVVVEEEEHFIARASQRYEMTEIEGRDGAIFDELGYSVVERPIYVQCLNINKIDDILAWLNGEGEFEYKGRKTTARFYSQLEPRRSSCIRIIDTTFIRDPFWCKVNEDYQLVKDRKDKQASGEYIHVEDSSNCRGKIGIGGNHEQETRSGKNYLNTLAKYKAGEKVTVDGITYIFNEDGSITCNGTATADSVLTFSSELQTINGSSKKIVGMLTGTQVPKKISILAYTSDWSKNTFTILSNVNKNITTNMQENIDYTIFRIIVYKETTLNNQTIYYQILDTSVNDLTYEQYGASPSPDYQSEVESVGSNINILPSNLFSSKALNGINYTNKDGIITVNGTATENSFYTKTITLKAGTYTLNGAPKGSAQDRYCLQAQGLGAGDFGSGQTFTIDTEKQVTLRIMVWKGITVNNIIFKPKIIKGTVATPYSKFGQGCVKVTKCNKNIFKPEEFSIINQNVTCSYKDGKFTLNGEVTSAFTIDISKHFDFNKIAQLTVNKNVTFSIQKYTGNIDFELNLGSRSSFYILQLRSLKKTKITKNLLEELTRFSLYVGVGKYNNFSFELQLEIGDNQTVSVGPAEQSYIMPMQAEMLENDYLDYDNEEEVHVWKKLVFDGITNRIANRGENNSKTWARFNGNDWDKKTDWVDYENMKCTHFIVNNSWGKGTTYAKFGNNGIMVQFVFNDNNLKTIEDVNNWLKSQYDAGTPVIVYYKQQTPTRLPFTDEQKAVAKDLNNARTYKNVTNITTDSKAILSLDYFTVTDEKIKNEGNIQSRPILRLEKTVSEAVDITINDVRFKYNFNNDKYVEIDCENKEVKFDGLERFRSIEIGYDFPKLNIGNNEITMNDGDCIIKVIRKDRWL